MDTVTKLRRHGLFDARVPRFTSYPPANRFTSAVGAAKAATWMHSVPSGARLSIYVHIPFCRRLCWFCACRTQGTRTDKPLAGYVETLMREIALVRAHLPRDVSIARLHLGGGTPTILPVALMTRLLDRLDQDFGLSDVDEFSVEVDPTECDSERLQVLQQYGLSRASLGVQDFDPEVQQAIGRRQTPDQTRRAVDMLADLGIQALNFDLLYGLPFQTSESLARTLDQVLDLQPSRLALYGYAHVPWASKRQVVIPAEALPGPETRFQLASQAAEQLVSAGLVPIGIDHFALPDDSLTRARQAHRLTRNFQGYTDDKQLYLIGLGASAISRYPQGFVQNEPATAPYANIVANGDLAATRGYALTPEDTVRADLIEQLMCYAEIDLRRLVPDSGAATEIMMQCARRYRELLTVDGSVFRLEQWAAPLARIVASDIAQVSEGTQSYSAAV